MTSSIAIGVAPLFIGELIKQGDGIDASHVKQIDVFVLGYLAARFLGQGLNDFRWRLLNPLLYKISYNLAKIMALRLVVSSPIGARNVEDNGAVSRKVAIISKMQMGSMGISFSLLSAIAPALIDFGVVAIILAVTLGSKFVFLLAAGGAIFIFATRFMRKSELSAAARANDADTMVFGCYGEIISNARIIKEFSSSSFFLRRLSESIELSIGEHRRLFSVKTTRSLGVTCASILLYGLVLFVAARMVGQGLIKLGELFLVAIYLDKTIQPMMSISLAINNLQTGMVSMIGGYELLDGEAGKKKCCNNFDRKYTLDCSDFHASKINLAERRIEVRQGDLVQISGYSGSGKTTLVSDFYDKIMEVDKTNERCVYLTAAPAIIPGTVEENIRFDSAISKKEIVEIVSLWGRLGNRAIDVGEKAESLSLGEKQFISLARVMLHHAEIIIIDEGTNSIDRRAEQHVLNELRSRLPLSTIVIISHRELQSIKPDLIFSFGEDREIFIPDSSSEAVTSRQSNAGAS
ncbi:ABC transporter ATP-binding protein [Burkholderia cepacia]|uniref:ABC transporter ATP-binding protein n=1 Tax=Burkholderia cepacia TaxID=292 RepID=UPI002AB7CB67|nr:ABC transporter ATP-binding protein [Burkholderia cepacia]